MFASFCGQGLEGKTVQQLEQQLRESWAESVVTNWKIWVPCQIVNLGFVPGHLQVTTISSTVREGDTLTATIEMCDNVDQVKFVSHWTMLTGSRLKRCCAWMEFVHVLHYSPGYDHKQ